MKRIDSFDVCIDQKATGENIKLLIEKSGYSIAEIQEMLHLESVQSIYRWRKGSIPSIDNLICLSKIFEKPIEEILLVKEKRRDLADTNAMELIDW